jgi:hypothetical protein
VSLSFRFAPARGCAAPRPASAPADTWCRSIQRQLSGHSRSALTATVSSDSAFAYLWCLSLNNSSQYSVLRGS